MPINPIPGNAIWALNKIPCLKKYIFKIFNISKKHLQPDSRM